eukprot:2237869-Amphidinium_carterae.1
MHAEDLGQELLSMSFWGCWQRGALESKGNCPISKEHKCSEGRIQAALRVAGSSLDSQWQLCPHLIGRRSSEQLLTRVHVQSPCNHVTLS